MEPIVGEERGQGGSRVFGVVVVELCQREKAGLVLGATKEIRRT